MCERTRCTLHRRLIAHGSGTVVSVNILPEHDDSNYSASQPLPCHSCGVLRQEREVKENVCTSCGAAHSLL